MRSGRLPRVYLLFVALTGLQLLLFSQLGAIHHVSSHGTAFMAFLLFALAWRSRLAWGVLVVVDAIPLFGGLSAIGMSGDVLWGNVALGLLTGIALEATLFSQAMRRFTRRQPARLRTVAR